MSSNSPPLCHWHGSAQGCWNGNNCRFSHSNPMSIPLCRYRSNCKYGNQCRFRHKIRYNNNNNNNSRTRSHHFSNNRHSNHRHSNNRQRNNRNSNHSTHPLSDWMGSDESQTISFLLNESDSEVDSNDIKNDDNINWDVANTLVFDELRYLMRILSDEINNEFSINLNLNNNEIKNIIKNLPIQIYKDNKNNSKSDDMVNNNNNDNEKNENKDTINEKCCICLEQFKNNDKLTRLPCWHLFHSNEIEKWLLKNPKCPICRYSII